MDWVRPPLLTKIFKNPLFYDKTLLKKVRPLPPLKKNPKKSNFFLIRKFWIGRDPPAPLSEFFWKKTKNSLFFLMPPIIYRSLGVLSQVQQATRCHVHLNQFCFKFHLKSTTTKADKVCVHYVSHSHITPIYRKHKHKISSADELTFA